MEEHDNTYSGRELMPKSVCFGRLWFAARFRVQSLWKREMAAKVGKHEVVYNTKTTQYISIMFSHKM